MKISEAQKGEKNHMYGKHISKEHRAKMIAGMKGVKRSEQARKNMSEAKKGKIGKLPSDTHREKVASSMIGENNPNYGKQKSDETKLKSKENRLKNLNTRKESLGITEDVKLIKFTDEEIKIIRELCKTKTCESISKIYNVTRKAISNIRSRKTYKHVE